MIPKDTTFSIYPASHHKLSYPIPNVMSLQSGYENPNFDILRKSVKLDFV